MRRNNQLIAEPIDTHCPQDLEFADLLEEVSAVGRYKEEMKWARALSVKAAKARLAKR